MKTALITGASRGIGKAIALHYAQQQYNIIITCNKNHVLLNEVAQEIRSYQVRCFTFVGDCSQSHNIKKLFQMISKEFSSLDVVVNNIGVSHIGLLQDMTDEAWDSLYRSNVSSMFYTCRECIPLMLSQSNGSIINISSIWGKVGASCEVAYSTTKGAMNAFTRSFNVSDIIPKASSVVPAQFCISNNDSLNTSAPCENNVLAAVPASELLHKLANATEFPSTESPRISITSPKLTPSADNSANDLPVCSFKIPATLELSFPNSPNIALLKVETKHGGAAFRYCAVLK